MSDTQMNPAFDISTIIKIDPPKRPATSYMQYVTEKLQTMKKKDDQK